MTEPPPGEPSDVEILDAVVIGSDSGPAEVAPSDPPRSRSIGLGITALVVAGAGLAVLANGDQTADSTSTPSTANAPEATAQVDDQTATTGRAGIAIVGDGPDLDWQRIAVPVSTSRFRWIHDAFVGDDGTTEWVIRPSGGATITQRSAYDPLDDDHYDVSSTGARVLAPRLPQPDHVLILRASAPSQTPSALRVELPTHEPTTDLVDIRTWIRVAVIDDRGVVAVSRFAQISSAALSERIGQPLSNDLFVRVFSDYVRVDTFSSSGESEGFDIDIDLFSAVELEALGETSQLATELIAVDLTDGSSNRGAFETNFGGDLDTIGDQFVFQVWGGDSSPSTMRSSDGVSWAQTDIASPKWNLGGDDLSWFGTNDSATILMRSADEGQTWERTRLPFSDVGMVSLRDHVVLAAFRFGGVDNASYAIDVGEFALSIVHQPYGQTFELRDASDDRVVSSGPLLPGSDELVRYDEFNGDLLVTDPTDGSVIRIPAAEHQQAHRSARQPPATPAKVAFVRWPGGDHPEWRVEDITDLFGPTAVEVEFVAGERHMLAVVGTTEGVDCYLAEIP